MTTYLKNIAVPKKYEEHVDFANEHFGLNDIIKANNYHTPLRSELTDYTATVREIPEISHVALLCPCDWEFEDIINPLKWNEQSSIECSSCHRVFTESDLHILPERKQIIETGRLDYTQQGEFNMSSNVIVRPAFAARDAASFGLSNCAIIYNDVNVSDSKISMRIAELRLHLVQSSRKNLKFYFKLSKRIKTLVFNTNDNTFRKSIFLSPIFQMIGDNVPIASIRDQIFVQNVNYENPTLNSLKTLDLTDDEFIAYKAFMSEVASAKNITFNTFYPELSKRATISQMHIDIITALNANNVVLFNDATNVDLTKCLHNVSRICNDSRNGYDTFSQPLIAFMLKLIAKKEQTSIKALMKLSFPHASKSNIKKLVKWFSYMFSIVPNLHQLDSRKELYIESTLKCLSVLDDPQLFNQIIDWSTTSTALKSEHYDRRYDSLVLMTSELMYSTMMNPSRLVKGGYGFNKQLRKVYARLTRSAFNSSKIDFLYHNLDTFNGVIRHVDLINSIKDESSKKQLKRDFVNFLANQPIKSINSFESNLLDYYASIKIQSPELQKKLERNCVKSLNQTKEDIMKFESKSENVTFSIPKRGIEMLILGDILNICVGGRGYQEAVANNDIQIIVANHNQTNDKIVIEYDKAKNAIIQAKSKFNKPLYLIKNDELQRETFDYLRNLTPIVESYDLGKTLPTGFSFNYSRYDQNFIAPVNQEPQHHMEMPEFDVLDLPDLDLPF